MYAPLAPKSELSISQLANLSQRFQSLNTVADLSKMLGITEHNVLSMAEKPEYTSFYIPKPGGEKRLIEHPGPKLKEVQNTLNRYLQSVYYGVKPACAYGFILRPTDDFQPRNIYFNAMRHQKGEWFLQIDLRNFFHTVTTTHLKQLFSIYFFLPARAIRCTQFPLYQQGSLADGVAYLAGIEQPGLSTYGCSTRTIGQLPSGHLYPICR